VSDGYLLAIDAGTGSCRAVAFDPAGKQVAMAQREWSHASLPDYPGSSVFNTASNWDSIARCVRELIDRLEGGASSILAVSTTSMREGMVLYDREGQELWACPNVDSRAMDESPELIARGLAEKIYFTGGDWIAITAPPRLLWIERHQPEVRARTAHLNMLSDWILYRLSGEYVTDPSVGSSSALFDLKTRTWSDELIDALGWPRSIFPEVVESGTAIGAVQADAAAATGLLAGTPVVVGGADTQMALVGIGRVQPGAITGIGGTFWQQTIGVDRPIIDPHIRLRTLCHSLPEQWMLEGIGFLPGLTMRWFRDAFCQWEKAQAEESGRDAYDLMEAAAAQAPPGSNGVIGIFSDLMNARRWRHASPSLLQFDITDPEHSGKKESIRAIEEGAAYVSRGHIDIIEELTHCPTGEIVLTGGAARGKLWPQILADVLGSRVQVPIIKESTALGAALYAGLGAGVYRDVASAGRDIVEFERTFEPNPGAHETYRTLYDQWRQVYDRSLAMVEEGMLRPMWRAAGA
jgi:autoinducer-2 kinase